MNSSSQVDVLFKPTFFKTEINPEMIDDDHPPKIKEEICDDREYSQSILHSHLTAKREYCSAAPIVQQQQKMFKKSQSIINRFNNNGEGDVTMTTATAMYRVNNGCIRSKKATETSTTKTAENFVVFKTTLPDDWFILIIIVTYNNCKYFY